MCVCVCVCVCDTTLVPLTHLLEVGLFHGLVLLDLSKLSFVAEVGRLGRARWPKVLVRKGLEIIECATTLVLRTQGKAGRSVGEERGGGRWLGEERDRKNQLRSPIGWRDSQGENAVGGHAVTCAPCCPWGRSSR